MSFDFFRLFPVAGESLHALDTEQPPLEVKVGRHAIGELDALQRALVIEKLVAGHFGVAHRLIETMPSLKPLEAAVHPVAVPVRGMNFASAAGKPVVRRHGRVDVYVGRLTRGRDDDEGRKSALDQVL